MSSPEAPIACSLDVRDAQTRRARWQALADAALIARDRTTKGARQIYRAEPQVERELSELIELEADCCPFLEFKLLRRGDELVLDVHDPDEADGIIDLFAATGVR